MFGVSGNEPDGHRLLRRFENELVGGGLNLELRLPPEAFDHHLFVEARAREDFLQRGAPWHPPRPTRPRRAAEAELGQAVRLS